LEEFFSITAKTPPFYQKKEVRSGFPPLFQTSLFSPVVGRTENRATGHPFFFPFLTRRVLLSSPCQAIYPPALKTSFLPQRRSSGGAGLPFFWGMIHGLRPGLPFCSADSILPGPRRDYHGRVISPFTNIVLCSPFFFPPQRKKTFLPSLLIWGKLPFFFLFNGRGRSAVVFPPVRRTACPPLLP